MGKSANKYIRQYHVMYPTSNRVISVRVCDSLQIDFRNIAAIQTKMSSKCDKYVEKSTLHLNR